MISLELLLTIMEAKQKAYWDWYNRQAQAYYKNPAAWKMPTLPTWDEYMGDAGIAVGNVGPELQALEQGGWNPAGGYQSTTLGNTRTVSRYLC